MKSGSGGTTFGPRKAAKEERLKVRRDADGSVSGVRRRERDALGPPKGPGIPRVEET
jgi:hypothetical protein